MGRQVQFHMLPDDLRMFLEFVQSRGPVTITLRSSDTAEVKPVENQVLESRVMALWNKTLLPNLERKLVARTGGDYYRIDDSLPTLELSPSLLAKWKNKQALLQGRVYGFFDKPNDEYGKWYDTIARWIRSHFSKSPVKLLGGYVGPYALKWFQEGGVLLPMFEPPLTSEWISFVANQHKEDISEILNPTIRPNKAPPQKRKQKPSP